MEEQTLDFNDYIGAFKRRRLSISLIAGTIFIVGALITMMWPATYQASATILIKEQDIPSNLVQSTVTSFASQRIQTISQKVMARANLLEIIEKYNLYTEEKKRLTTEQLIAEMRENVNLEMISAEVVDPRSGRPMAATIAFQLQFSGKIPSQVQKVVNELMSLFLAENLKERSEKAGETYSFLSDESDRLKREIEILDTKLARFKETHVHTLPQLNQFNLQMMDRTEREIQGYDSRIRTQEQQKIYLNGQLATIKPYGASMQLDPATRLQGLRTEYLALTARYSPEHPDVKRMKKEIAGLEQEVGGVDSSAEQMRQLDMLRGDLAALEKKYSAQHPDVIKLRRQIVSLEEMPVPSSSKLATAAGDNPDSPTYINLKTQIEAIEGEVRALEKKKLQAEEKLADYEQRVIETPQVERAYKKLTRDLDSTTIEYRNTLAKKMSAEISQQLERENKGERFVIIEPPIIPEKPVSPNRPALFFLSIVLALGCGIGYAAMAETLDDRIRGSKGLLMAIGSAPLAMIPYQENDTEITVRKRRFAMKTAAAFGAIIIVLTSLHLFWKPLDVLWYKAVRKADVIINT